VRHRVMGATRGCRVGRLTDIGERTACKARSGRKRVGKGATRALTASKSCNDVELAEMLDLGRLSRSARLSKDRKDAV
jgi:hypothetical protein